ncbi:MAG: amino acid ABC transporter ATP-binding protein, partial [Selenomonadaceae bacterium]|nr:amino acid ABC transporter ATP-binding protein [Selenomonadaceae bacterium]
IFDSPQREKTVAFIQKRKYFTYEIRSKEGFDLMELQGGIWSFAEKYGIGGARVYALQYCAEELIYEFFDYSFRDTDAVQMTLALTYAQAQDVITLELESSGAAYDPFLTESEAAEDDDAHIGITILKKRVENFAYRFDEGVNRVRLEL